MKSIKKTKKTKLILFKAVIVACLMSPKVLEADSNVSLKRVLAKLRNLEFDTLTISIFQMLTHSTIDIENFKADIEITYGLLNANYEEITKQIDLRLVRKFHQQSINFSKIL